MVETTKALLLTRPEAQSHEFLAMLEALAGSTLPHVIAPLFQTRATGAAIPDTGVLVVTSARAIEAVGAALAGRQLYAVGSRTAALARQAGARVAYAGADLSALVERLSRDCPGPLVHLRGSHAVADLPALLPAADVTEVRVYESADRPFSAEAEALLAGPAAVLAPVFSPRSGRLLALAARDALPRLAIVAISAAAAEPMAGAARLRVAAAPDAEAMARAVLSLWADLP